MKEIKQDMTFEASVARLEEIVRCLESGSAELGESLRLFEEGTALVRYCTEALDSAEQQVKKLVADQSGRLVETDME